MGNRVLAIGLAAVLGSGLAVTARADVDVSGAIDDVRRTQLEVLVARDQERLKQLLSEPRGPDAPPLHEDPELRELAARLPGMQRELRHRIARAEAAQRAAARAASPASGATEPSPPPRPASEPGGTPAP